MCPYFNGKFMAKIYTCVQKMVPEPKAHHGIHVEMKLYTSVTILSIYEMTMERRNTFLSSK